MFYLNQEMEHQGFFKNLDFPNFECNAKVGLVLH
jgi:hypothetical protein